ncbi:MAG: pyruvate/2-oxoglutarate dehydrogenase complex, dihydrolipoamide dehydrogenase component [Deltaproteobacteria bacterium]|jgi:pyruvate/2-oxoglutarate dehydrogenase complex dihydrolipoamide dehydrogenase (E3) component|nr:pyruvate/2-oxoglutarate dehydrogenase complex, dihydrolipoamide dehydrogenase component [Deltaproteobacteria bacterium]
MAQHDYDIAILGGGAAGLTIAAGAAQAGAKTLIIEKESKLGGDCLHYGCVPSKTLIRTARVRHLIKNAQNFGLPGIDLKRPDFRDIAGRIRSVINIIQKHDSEERFCSLGAKVEFGQATFIDDHSVSLNGKEVSARNWVIATGSSAAIPPIEGLNQTPYITNREVFSLERLPDSMVIVGGGPIGIELAQAFTRLGTKITVIEFLPQILNADDQDMTNVILEILKSEGVEVHLNSAVQSVRNLGNEREVTFKSGEEIKNIRTEAILIATGRKVNLEGLGLEGIGVSFDRRGLKLSPRLRTTLPHIYGAGDVTGVYQFTHAAGYEGGIVLSNAIFRFPRKVDYGYLPWVTYTDPELACIGMNEKMAKAQRIRYKVWSEPFESNDRSLAEGETVGKIKMLLDEKEKPIGIQILGPHAGDLLSEWVAIMNGNVKLSTIASAVHPYPTLGEINKRVAGNFLATKIFSDRVKKTLRLFFNLKGRACGE